MIAAGEQSGHLADVLNPLANDLEDQQTLRAKLLSASLYPAIVSLVALAIVIFLVTSVVPQVAGVFAGTKQQLPGFTVALLAISDFVRTWGWLILLVLVAGAWTLRLALRQSALRLGEQTGQLPVMLQRAAQQLSGEVQRRALALATVLEPLLIVAMGGVVMLIVLAVLMPMPMPMPIMQLNQWVK